MNFEDKKFCKLQTLMERWDCSRDLILDLVSKQLLKPWHPKGEVGQKGLRIDVASVLNVEKNGYI
jgi:hypothetical protein